jgi:flagellar motor switch protein FliM
LAVKNIKEVFMEKVLSKEEIEQLLAAINEKEEDKMDGHLSKEELDKLISAPGEEDNTSENWGFAMPREGKIKIYDFSRPDKFTKDNMRIICLIHELFAANLTTYFSKRFSGMAHVHAASYEQVTFEEFLRSGPVNCSYPIFTMNPLKGKTLLKIEPSIIGAMEKLVSGENSGSQEQNKLADSEKTILRDVFDGILTQLKEAWKNVTDMEPVISSIETNPQFCRIVPVKEMAVMVSLKCKIFDTEGVMRICYPYPTVEPIMEKLTTDYWFSKKLVEKEPIPPVCEVLDKVIVPVTVLLGEAKLTLKELRSLEEGSLIKLDAETGEPVKVFAGDQFIANAEVVVIDDQFGVRVTEVNTGN